MVELGPWTEGMNNRLPDNQLQRNQFRNGVNVDVTGSGSVRRRKGLTRVYSGFPKNGYSCHLGAFFVENSTVKKFGTTMTDIQTVSGDVCFHYLNGVLYFSDSVSAWKYDGAVRRWGMAIPAAPVLFSAAGAYGAGYYLGAVCFVDNNGVESGASPLARILVNDNSGIVFTHLPTTSDPQVEYVRLYLSTANGNELYHVADVSLGTSSYSVLSGNYDEGITLEHQGIDPAPSGTLIRDYNGRLYVIDGNVAWYTDPLEYDHFRLSSNYLVFPNNIDIFEPVSGGIFVAHGKVTEFHAGNPEDGFQVISLFDYGAVAGTGRSVPNSSNVMWQSVRGTVIGMPDGSAKNIQESNVAPDSGDAGTSLIREQDGIKQFVTVINNASMSGLAAKSFIDAEIVRRS